MARKKVSRLPGTGWEEEDQGGRLGRQDTCWERRGGRREGGLEGQDVSSEGRWGREVREGKTTKMATTTLGKECVQWRNGREIGNQADLRDNVAGRCNSRFNR